MRIESFLKQSPVFQLSHSTRRIEVLLNRALHHDGLTFLEALVLAAIFFEKKGVKPSDLAGTLRMTRGNISHAIQRGLDVFPVFNGLGRGDPHGLHGTAGFLRRTTVLSLGGRRL